MPVEIRQIDNEPMYVAIFTEPFITEETTPITTKALSDALAATDGTVYYISDFTQIKLTFNQLVSGLADAFAGKVQTPFTNPRLHMIIVGDDEFVRLGAQAAKQEQYGSLDIQLFPTIDEAIAHARQKLAA